MEYSPSEDAEVYQKQRKPKWANRQHLIRITDRVWKRWNDLKSKNESRSHDDFARMLIDSWDRSKSFNADADVQKSDLASTSEKQQMDHSNGGDGQHQPGVRDEGKRTGVNCHRDVISERKAVCLHTELLKLANLRIKQRCTQKFCNRIVSATAKYVGTSVQLNWKCSQNHQVNTWNSQPNINSIPATDLLLSSVMPSTDYPLVHITFKKIGLEIMPPRALSPTPSSETEDEDVPTGEMDEMGENSSNNVKETISFKGKSESNYPGQNIGKSTKCEQNRNFSTNEEEEEQNPNFSTKVEEELNPNFSTKVEEELNPNFSMKEEEEDVCPDSNIEESTVDDMIMDHKEIKIEVDVDESQMDTDTDSGTDEEFDDIINYLSNTNKVLKVTEDGESSIQDNRIRSERIKKKGFRPNYAALEWKEDDSGNSVKTEAADDIKHYKDENESMVESEDKIQRQLKTINDLDFMIPEEIEDEGSEDDVSEDETVDSDDEDDVDICDEIVSKENELAGAQTTSKKTNKCSYENKLEPKRKRLRRCNKNKQKAEANVNKTKKPWIKIHLADHEDKYKLETMESFERKNRKIDASENLYSCLVCQHYKCSSKDAMEDHLEKHINKVLECENCQYVAYCDTDIREHRRHCSQTVKALFVCDICGAFISSYDSKKNHMGRIHGIAEWKCLYCPELFRARNERLDHMRHTHPEPCQYCDSCRQSKHRLSKEEFKSHVENCSPKVQCQICGMFVGLTGMNKHIYDKHENVRKYQCHKCPYSAKSAKRLKTHVLSHENIHPHSCGQCSFTCIQPYQLTSHMRTHTGEKPYKCTQCKYAAAWNVQLKEHVKVHSLETAVICHKCDIMFKNEKALNIHIKRQQCML